MMVQQTLATRVARNFEDMRNCNECVPVFCCQELASLLACKTRACKCPSYSKTFVVRQDKEVAIDARPLLERALY